jgi:Rrf2 family cysteine metabolism transcriptional repressor
LQIAELEAIGNRQSAIIMRVSAKAEYACIAILELAANYPGPQLVRVKTIADAHGIPQRFLVQILLQLKGAGLVVSVRGASGGYQLARAPEAISLADVINLIDRAPRRPDPVASPRSSAVQTVRAVWRELQAEEQRILEELTFAELLRRARESHALSYQI